MKKTEFSRAIRDLDYLSLLEYREPIEELTRSDNPDEKIQRFGRLIGVMLKEPFAKPRDLGTPSAMTHAYRGWDFDEKSLQGPSKRRTWQYRVIRSLKNEHMGRTATLTAFINDARHERGFFKYFAQSLHKYLCGDAKIRRKVESALKAGRKAGTPLSPITPESMVAAGGGALGVVLVQSVPILGIAGAPVIAAVVVILYSVGLDAFCGWVSASYGTRDIEQ